MMVPLSGHLEGKVLVLDSGQDMGSMKYDSKDPCSSPRVGRHWH